MSWKHLSPKKSQNLFWYINGWKVIDMSERLKISLSRLKVALNIFVCSLLVLLLIVPFTTAINTKNGDYQALENDSYTIGVQDLHLRSCSRNDTAN